MSTRRAKATRRRKRIAVVTGTRAEYGTLRSTLAAIDANPRLELELHVTGMHLLRAFGRTVDEIVADGQPIASRVPMQAGDDAPTDQAYGLALGVQGLAVAFERSAPDIVLVLGDRIEALAGALAAVTTGRVLAHIHGGDVAPGDFDDSLRHAITKLAHIHFAATRASARRIVRLGEAPERVHRVGAPGLDRLRELLVASAGCARSSGTALVIQHAYGRDAATEQRIAERVLSAVAAAGLRRTLIYPNTDRGFQGVLRAIRGHARAAQNGCVQVRRSLPRDEYLRALIEADVLVGNSSSGLIEAPLAGTPSLCVGQRQAGREPGGRCVVWADESPASIRRGLSRALRMRPRRGGRTVYGDGQAGRRIAELLAGLRITRQLVRKQITY